MKRLIRALTALALAAPLAALAAVNLNTAGKDELVALPGIGPAKAQAIIDYRTANGPFRAVEDVRKVKGIGEKLYMQIKPELTVSGGGVAKAPAPSVTVAKAPEAKSDAKASASGEGKSAARADGGRIGATKDDKPRK